MKRLTHRLLDGKFDYPGLILNHDATFLLFDCGEGSFRKREVNRIRAVFLSHLHMDHFLGFDRLIAKSLGNEATIRVYGPSNTARQVLSKLTAYTWNLVRSRSLTLHVTELGPSGSRSCAIVLPDKLDVSDLVQDEGPAAITGPGFRVDHCFLDHGIHSIAYAFQEHDQVNVDRGLAQSRGLPGGRALGALKSRYAAGERPPHLQDVFRITSGRKVVYATDFAFSKANIEALVPFGMNADHLYLGVRFLARDQPTADATHHLTAEQAGYLAREMDARTLHLFHHSWKNAGMEALFIEEASRHFKGETR